MSKSLSSLNPTLQLLILLARLDLTKKQEDAVLELCQQVDDWPKVVSQAQERMILPLAYRHLRRLSPSTLQEADLGEMKRRSMIIMQRNMIIMAAQKALVSELMQPLGIPFMFFKGPALSLRYYDEPMMRLSRDIDVLVPQERMAELLEAALAHGYTPYEPSPLKTDRNSLDFLARQQTVVTLISPHGVGIEFHQRIDRFASLFDTADLLGSSEGIASGSVEFPVMPTNELFVYLCFHHTKHFWSHLHWFVDIDAIQRHPEFDLEIVRKHAAKRKLTATVEASLELYHAMATPEPWSYEPMSEHARELRTSSLIALDGGLEKEHEMHKKMATPDFAFSWQCRSSWLRWKTMGWIRLFRPSYADYHSWPLPREWQWVYRLVRPFRESYSRLTSK